MASITEKVVSGEIVSCRFRALLGREANGKQIFKTKTWYPPQGLTIAKVRKLAKVEAELWETEEKEKMNTVKEYKFDEFINDVWLPSMQDGTRKQTAIIYYSTMLKRIVPYFEGKPLKDINELEIKEFLASLRLGENPLSEKSIKHYYTTFSNIFKFACKHDFLTKNPIDKIDVPKVTKKSVDTLTQEETATFFNLLEDCQLDFKAMTHLFITTGLRRGECLGLQWQDVDFDNATITVNRSATYILRQGVKVSTPKTNTSIRTIPVMPSVLSLLAEWKRQQEHDYQNAELGKAFVFGSPTDRGSPLTTPSVNLQNRKNPSER